MEEKDGVQKLTRDERETILIYNEAAGYWEIFTAVAKHIRKFDKLKYECTRTEYYENGEVYGKYYKVPKNAIAFRDYQRKREYSEEFLQAASERLKAAREKKTETDTKEAC